MNSIRRLIDRELADYYSPDERNALAKYIGCDLLGLSLVEYYADKDMILSAERQTKLHTIIRRLRLYEPLEYIAGSTEFCGLRLQVSPSVLIPRPETSELVELIVKQRPAVRRVLDVGTGSGCIAIAIASQLPQAYVEAWDISEDALSVARTNADSLRVPVTFRHVDVLTEAPVCEPFDVIVSNPPYIARSEAAQMAHNVLDWEPNNALFVPDEDPLLFYRRIGEIGKRLLSANSGALYLEINQRFGHETQTLLYRLGYTDVQLLRDMSGNDRFVIAAL
ncbi:MAG: peptide chain release factor N(5)-glutamine methyltransferase [Prevotellaceae bacterium]|jgi:release factor glutamine methyltransferase|nr:peptide chain release factor N(5)-glutamine methyltransferase [Prevotellaceae bacterium]